MARLLIASENLNTRTALKNFLIQNEFEVVGISVSGSETLRKVRILRPDFLITDFDLPDMSGLNLAKILTEDKLCGVLLLTTPLQRAQIDRTNYSDENLSGIICIEKPVNKSLLLNTLNIIMLSNRKINMLEKEVEDLKDKLETKKYIERAKGILMQHSDINESEAYRRLQKKSMDSGIPMKEIAKLIISTMGKDE